MLPQPYLLFNSEVLPLECGIDVVTVQFQNLVMADDTRVGEIPNASEIPLGHLNRDRQKLIQNSHGVGNVYHLQVSMKGLANMPTISTQNLQRCNTF